MTRIKSKPPRALPQEDIDNYRDTAIYKSLRHHMFASEFTIRCAGCSKALTARRKGGWDGSYMDRGEVQHRLAERAVKEGWDIDHGGSIACAACTERLAVRSHDGF